MFDQLRSSFRTMFDAARTPADRRAVVAEMRETLVRARLGVDDLRRGVAETRARRDAAQTELETTRRRGRLAADVGDAETVAVAARFEAQQAERLAVLERKLAAQEDELALVERQVGEMTADFRRAAAGVPPGGASGAGGVGGAEARAAAEVDELLRDTAGGASGADAAAFDALSRQQDRATREADADARLAELKRRMGK
jgi:phage shock protein A